MRTVHYSQRDFYDDGYGEYMACADTLGRLPSDAELEAWLAADDAYSDGAPDLPTREDEAAWCEACAADEAARVTAVPTAGRPGTGGGV